ncbi:VolA/Pla-1 family phospholipase [Vibrio splendidus]|uniref:VolA/Pla-1 family phospholipase n=1 Tax=Vibrio splendidus TaxID=29497 RepID=UPI000D3A9A05|nr:VolA/Pla-1 family phospholipase [Vibrio splendidus]PTP01483.1 lipase [Vibrio splendidus]PTQ07201.1 lipase [Vibrio splendidus]
MKKLFNVSLLASAMFLAGCGDDSSSSGASTAIQYEQYIQDSLAQATSIKFQLTGADIAVPLPSFALMDATDGTLGLPTSGDDSLTNPIAAMNTMDGWSTSMPIIMNFEGTGLADGFATGGVYLLKLSGSLTSETAPSVAGVLTLGTDFNVLSSASTDTFTIVFNESLDSSSEYVLALSNELTDVNGDPVGMSASYAALKSSAVTYTEGSLAQAQKVTQGVETIFAGANAAGKVSLDSKDIIYSTWFTTESVGSSLFATKAATATGLASANLNGVWKGSANPNSVDLTTAYAMQFVSTETFKTALTNDVDFDKYIGGGDAATIAKAKGAIELMYGATDNVDVSQGFVQLPYYLETSATEWNAQPFESGMPSLAKVSNALSNSAEQANMAAQLVAAGIDTSILATSQTEQLKLIGLNLTLADGSPLDIERVLTKYSPVPQVKSLEAVEFLLFTPNGSDPANVVIYQHGITSAKENAYAFAYNLARAGTAVLAIDLPLHGTRSLDDTRSANADVLAYLNLANLPVARDNVRQSALDVMGLRAALAVSSQATLLGASPLKGFDLTKGSQVKFLGHSLGGIVGTTAVAASNRTLGSVAANSLYSFSAAAIENSGGQISNLLLGSTEFGPQVKHNVALSASTEYASFASATCASLSDKLCYETFETNATTAQLAVMTAAFQQFAYAAQTVLDTIDPFTNADHLLSSGSPVLPIYMGQVKDDDTVPNSVASAPFAGTTPLATKLGLTVVDSSNTTPNGTKDFVKFNDVAFHSTFVLPKDTTTPTPLDSAHYAEMQAEALDFLVDNKLDSVSNAGSVLE